MRNIADSCFAGGGWGTRDPIAAAPGLWESLGRSNSAGGLTAHGSLKVYDMTYNPNVNGLGLGLDPKLPRRDSIRERGSAPKRGRHSAIFFPPHASLQWQPDGLTIHTKKWFPGAGFLGAPPIYLIQDEQNLRIARPEDAGQFIPSSLCRCEKKRPMPAIIVRIADRQQIDRYLYILPLRASRVLASARGMRSAALSRHVFAIAMKCSIVFVLLLFIMGMFRGPLLGPPSS